MKNAKKDWQNLFFSLRYSLLEWDLLCSQIQCSSQSKPKYHKYQCPITKNKRQGNIFSDSSGNISALLRTRKLPTKPPLLMNSMAWVGSDSFFLSSEEDISYHSLGLWRVNFPNSLFWNSCITTRTVLRTVLCLYEKRGRISRNFQEFKDNGEQSYWNVYLDSRCTYLFIHL